VLWVGGYLMGSGRVPGATEGDATVGLATVAQVGGELMSGALTLLDSENRYGAMALLRQLIEVEYLAWAFAEDGPRAAKWLRSSKEDRLRMWQPRQLRDASAGRFRGRDYGDHCERAGHPTPSARDLLPGHEARLHEGWIWYELATHGTSLWDYLADALHAVGYASVLEDHSAVLGLTAAFEAWRRGDGLRSLTAEVRAFIRDEPAALSSS
jgi:hypothetical protein